MALRWFNLVGFVMLFLALFFNEVVYLNVWYDFNFYTVFPAIAYIVIAIWLSLWPGAPQEPAH